MCRMVGRQVVLLCLVGTALPGGRYWWMGTDVFQAARTASINEQIQNEGEIIWPSDEDVYVLKSRQDSFKQQSTGSDNSFTKQSNDDFKSNPFKHQSNDNSYEQQSNDNSYEQQSNDNSYEKQSNDNSYEQSSNVMTYTDQSNVWEEPINDNSYSGIKYKTKHTAS